MRYSFSFFLVVIIAANGVAQNRSLNSSYSGVVSPDTESFFHKTLWGSFFSGDKQQLYRPKSILPMTIASSHAFKGGIYWMESMTTQSYNQGKLGTYYIWDVQNNLRESRMFLDIAGKNKRGLKLVFLKR